MKLGLINDWNEAGFQQNAKLGLEAIEFCINWNVDSAEVLAKKDEIKALSEKYKVVVTSIGRWGMERVDAKGEIIPEALQHDKNLVDLASYLSCPVFNLGCNFVKEYSFDENCAFAINYISKVLDYAREKGVKVAIYNCDWANFIYEDKAWAVIFNALPEVGIKYDSSHCVNRGGNHLMELHNWGKKIYHFHAKGLLRINNSSYDDPPAGLDSFNWGEIFTLLYISGYNGTVSIEPHSGRWQGAMRDWGTEFSVKYLRQFVMPEDYKF